VLLEGHNVPLSADCERAADRRARNATDRSELSLQVCQVRSARFRGVPPCRIKRECWPTGESRI
jgi:hypothetical protein